MKRSNFHLFPARIGRVSYLFRNVLLLVAALVASIMLEMSPFASSAMQIPLSARAVMLLIFIFILLCLFRSILFPRLRDVGWNTAWALLVFVPVINVLFVLALLFAPGRAVEEQRIAAAGLPK